MFYLATQSDMYPIWKLESRRFQLLKQIFKNAFWIQLKTAIYAGLNE